MVGTRLDDGAAAYSLLDMRRSLLVRPYPPDVTPSGTSSAQLRSSLRLEFTCVVGVAA